MVTLGKGPEKNLMYMTTLWPRALGELLLKAEVPVLLAFRATGSNKRLGRAKGEEVDSSMWAAPKCLMKSSMDFPDLIILKFFSMWD